MTGEWSRWNPRAGALGFASDTGPSRSIGPGEQHVHPRAKGLSNRRVIGVHLRRTFMIPVVTGLGLEFGNLVAFSVATETIFAWPGMGKLLISSIQSLDRPVIVAYLIVIVLMFVALNLIVDILYSVLDPRVRLGEKSALAVVGLAVSRASPQSLSARAVRRHAPARGHRDCISQQSPFQAVREEARLGGAYRRKTRHRSAGRDGSRRRPGQSQCHDGRVGRFGRAVASPRLAGSSPASFRPPREKSSSRAASARLAGPEAKAARLAVQMIPAHAR